jgi:class 3 adenylate cyclase/tetratricopeptide (TPR) repeat protein
MDVCPSCGTEVPDGSRFCLSCGGRLGGAGVVTQERKVVTILFCDLVGFTAMSEAADPEDVDTVLRGYGQAVRRVIESHGGVVEKFIGDAVVGVFGVPVAHEDDPERGVRAGLRILEALDGLERPDGSPLEARVGVNTGETLVRLGVDPASGSGVLVGDAINTAARLQAAAAPMTVLAGPLTHDLTLPLFAWEQRAGVRLKGKASPLDAWRAVAPVSRGGPDVHAVGLSPFVGREGDIAYLVAMFDAAVSNGAPRLALVVGEAGIGKTRLLRELYARLDARPEMIRWRQGRCPPFGEGLGFWPLAEIVRGHCGILETDDRETARARLGDAVARLSDPAWMLDRLAALLGLEAPAASREENFAAWLRFLEALAADRPAVLIVEDVQWADEGMVAFLEYLAERVADVSLVVLATARPESAKGRLPFADARSHVARLALTRLSPRETGVLVDGLLGETTPDDAARARVVERCGGNPLFAEQCARLVASGAGGPGGPGLPGSVQAVIAARLDSLPPEVKAAAGDAAVVGIRFWDGALAALASRSREETGELVRSLRSHQLVSRARASSMADELEYVFAHTLAREVAYRQLPRATRAHKHAAVARWLEAKCGGHPEELAELLAHHYSTAHELARSSGAEDLAAQVRGPAARFLELAGDRVANVDLPAARTSYAAAYRLTAEDDPARGILEAKLGEAHLWSGESAEAEEHLRRAAGLLLEAGDTRRVAVTLVRLSRALHSAEAGADEISRLHREAIALLDDDGPSVERVTVLTEWGRQLGNEGDMPAAVAVLERALEDARVLDVPEPALTLNLLAGNRATLGSTDFIDDSRRSVELAEAQGSSVERARVWLNHACWLTLIEGPRRSLQELDRALAFATSRGLIESALFGRINRFEPLFLTGSWDEALSLVDALDEHPLAVADEGFPAWARLFALVPRAWRGDAAARVSLGPLLHEVRRSAYAEDAVFGLAVAAVVTATADSEAGRRLVCEMVDTLEQDGPAGSWGLMWLYEVLPELVRICTAARDLDLAERIVRRPLPDLPAHRRALLHAAAQLAEARGEHEQAAAGFADAAARWHDFGVPYEEGHALLGVGRCLVALGRAPEAAAPLAAAHELFARLGAEPALADTEEWLAKVPAAADAGAPAEEPGLRGAEGGAVA